MKPENHVFYGGFIWDGILVRSVKTLAGAWQDDLAGWDVWPVRALLYLQSCATTATTKFRTFSSPQKEALYPLTLHFAPNTPAWGSHPSTFCLHRFPYSAHFVEMNSCNMRALVTGFLKDGFYFLTNITWSHSQVESQEQNELVNKIDQRHRSMEQTVKPLGRQGGGKRSTKEVVA